MLPKCMNFNQFKLKVRHVNSKADILGSNTECFTLNVSDPKSVKCRKPRAGNSTSEFLQLRGENTNTSEYKDTDKQAGHQKRNIKHIGLEKIKASEYLLFVGVFLYKCALLI